MAAMGTRAGRAYGRGLRKAQHSLQVIRTLIAVLIIGLPRQGAWTRFYPTLIDVSWRHTRAWDA